VDDEPLARLNLSSLLEPEPDFELVGECSDAVSAVAAIAQGRLQLVFLDVQMPGQSGFDVLGAVPEAALPAVVFVTAHQEFAVRAFEAQALDYLLKPFRRERFQTALDRARARVLGKAAPRAAVNSETDRMAVKCGNRLVFVALEEIDFIRAAANYVSLQIGEQVYEVREKIGEIAGRLPAGRFMRIHRSYVVRLAHIHALYPVGGGEYMVALRSGRELPIGGSYLPAMRAAFAGASIPRLGGAGTV